MYLYTDFILFIFLYNFFYKCYNIRTLYIFIIFILSYKKKVLCNRMNDLARSILLKITKKIQKRKENIA